MSMKLAEEELEKLKDMKSEVDDNQFSDQPLIDQAAKKDIEKDLQRKAGNYKAEEDSFSFDEIGNINKKKKKKIKVESYGTVAKVNVDFEQLGSEIDKVEYDEIIEALDTISQTNNNQEIRQAISIIESY